MASIKNAIVKTKVENEIVELMVKSNVANIVLDDGTTTLAAKLAEMIAAINERAKSVDVTAQISAAIDGIIDGAPAAYNTLKEIADYLATHQNEYTALLTSVGGKVDKVEGKGLSTEDFTTALKTKLESLGTLAAKSKVAVADLDADLKTKIDNIEASGHSHTNKAVLDGITGDKVAAWDNKPDVHIQNTQPTTLKTGDIWIQTID